MAQTPVQVPAPGEGDGAKPASSIRSERLVSLDVLRGYTMFWIIGADGLFEALQKIRTTGWQGALARQFQHVPWIGIHFYDLIFPMFVFIMGVSVVFSLDRIVERHGKTAAHVRVIRRAALIFLLGVFYDEGIANWHRENIICGVLQRIGLCYLISSLLYLNLRVRGLIITCVSILIAYWALLSVVPVPGETVHTFLRHHNWTDYIQHLMPPYHDSDPEGYLSTLPAACSGLLGVFVGLLFKNEAVDDRKRVQWLLVGGAVMIVTGLLWSIQFPIIKRIWTSPYVLVAGGHSAIMLAIFYTVIDRWKVRRWATPFLWIGMNPLTLYLTGNVIPMDTISRRFVGGEIERACGVYGELLVAATSLALILLLARFLYERKIFIRV